MSHRKFYRLSLRQRSQKRLVQPAIPCFQRLSATLFLYGSTICCKVLCQVGDQVALAGHAGGAVGEPGGSGGIHSRSAVHEVGVEPRGFDLLLCEVAGQLVDDGADHFHVAQLLRSDVRQESFQLRVRHGEALAEVA